MKFKLLIESEESFDITTDEADSYAKQLQNSSQAKLRDIFTKIKSQVSKAWRKFANHNYMSVRTTAKVAYKIYFALTIWNLIDIAQNDIGIGHENFCDLIWPALTNEDWSDEDMDVIEARTVNLLVNYGFFGNEEDFYDAGQWRF